MAGGPGAGGTRALDLPVTAEELGRYRRGGLRLAVGGFALAFLALVCFGFLPEEPLWAEDLAGFLCVGGATACAFGLVRLPNARRFRRILASGRWSAHPATAVSRSWSGEAVVLAGVDGGDLLTLRVIASRARWQGAQPSPTGVLWWCGDPRRGGVLAVPGGGPLFRAKPVRGAAARQRLLAVAEETRLTELPVPAQPQAAPGLPAAPSSAAVPSYARFAAHAESWAVAPPRRKRPRRPEPDVRAAAWWRVRTLRRVAGLAQVGGGLIGLVLYGTLMAVDVFWPEEGAEDSMSTGSPLLVTAAGAWTLWASFQVWNRGLPVVRVLVRAALAPVPVERRYALVPAPVGEETALVVFPAHGGPDDRPEAVLPLLPPDRPVEPTGTVELRGWLDRNGGDDDGDAVVVAWCDGRPLWPSGPYLEAGSADGAAFLESLVDLMEAEPVPGPAAQD
ncbi:hypothetical protein [Streptomyces griseus]|uniref:hypothetical protein n=1 Tax=Streptomyces griseus TaxID=1911 RepID=UPI000AB23357|nr:hypothetical protein [Streptomyces griseus]